MKQTQSERELAHKLARITCEDAHDAIPMDHFQRLLRRHFREGTCHIEKEVDRKQTMLDLARRVRSGDWRFIRGRR